MLSLSRAQRHAASRLLPALMILIVVALYAFASARIMNHFSQTEQQDLHFEHLSVNDAIEINDVTALFNSADFKPLAETVVSLGFQPTTQLFRARFSLPAAQSYTLFMHTYVEASRLDVYFRFADGHIETQRFGTEQPFWQRDIPSTHLAAAVEQPAAQEVDVLIIMDSVASISFIASIAPSSGYLERLHTEQAVGWMMIGGLIMMGLYNLFLSFLVRSRVHFYYSCYVFSLAAMQVVLSGLGYKYLWSDGAQFISAAASPITVASVGFCATLFARKFLATPELTPWADRAVLTIPIFAFVVVAAIWFVPMIVVIEMALVLAAYFMLIISIMVLAQLRKKNPNAKLFALAWMFFVLGGSLTTGVYQGLVPANFFTFNGSNIGGLVEAIVLALALANQLNTLRDEKEQAEEQTRLALLQRNQALEESNKIKDRFLATISHELRTPLNSMIGSFDLLKRDRHDISIQRDLIQNGLTSGEHLNSLVDKLLEFTEIESGQYAVVERNVNLNYWFESIQSRYREVARQQKLAFRCEAPLANEEMSIDSELLTKIAIQLLDNAFRFTEQGYVVFQVFMNDHKQLRIHIADSGCGIPDHKKQWLSESFSQMDQSEQRQHGGLGVGLALTQVWVKLLKGRFELTDSAEGGLAVNIQLPTQPPRPTNQSATKPTRKLTHRRVLVVEDSPINQQVMAAMLRQLDYTYATANNGLEALATLVNDQQFDFILMDCEMPELNGYQTSEAIRQSPASYRAIPIFAVTANAMSTDRTRCLAAGMDDYLAKPIRVHKLEALIQSWFET